MRAHRPAALALALAGAACVSSSASTDRMGGAAATANAIAAPPPRTGADVLRMMHDRYAGQWYSTLAFRQRTELRTPADTMAVQTWYETAMLPGRLRIERGARDGRNVVLYRGDSVYVRRNGGPFEGRGGARNGLMTLGFDVYAQPLEASVAQVTAAGYDMTKVSEATWRGRPVWVVGAAPGDVASSQFWVDKARLVYVRSLERGLRNTTQRAEIVFGDYAPLAGGWIAREVTITEGGRLLQREVYSEIEANPAVSPESFDPAKLDAAPAAAPGATPPTR